MSRHPRSAFTLLELLIVLAVLATMMTVSWPAISGLVAKNELRSAAKQVRAALAKTRLEAMETGSVRQFRYQPGTNRFQISRLAAADDELPGSRGAPPSDEPAEVSPDNLLPAAVRFERSPTPGAAAGLVPPPEPLDAAWSAPLLFFPNGRTSNARLLLRGRRDFQVQVTLRGVTGTVTIGNLERPPEEP